MSTQHPAIVSMPGDRSIEENDIRSKESLRLDPATGGETFILRRSRGMSRADRAHLLEYHTCHEQSFLLEGNCNFAGFYQWQAVGYMTHPPFWWHPAGYTFTGPGMTLVKLDKPVDFVYTDVPANWDTTEWFADESDHECKNKVVSNAHLDAIPWETVSDTNGASAGFEAKRVWDDVETGWTTWLVRYPAGWQGREEWNNLPGGDELYLLDGSLTLHDRGITLTKGGYVYDPDIIIVGGANTSTADGFTGVRYTKGFDHWILPAVQTPARQGA